MSQINKPFIPINKGQFTLETEKRINDFEVKRGFGVESEYKENRKLWTDYAKNQHVSDFPLHVDIELASICNLQCPMCYTISPEFKEKVNTTRMDFELYKKLIDECASSGVYSIRLSLRGESFLHKRILDCVRYAKEKGIKEVSTLTNGVRLDEEMFKDIMDAGIDWITISIDGVGETYEQIRKPAKFDRTVEKITNFEKIKKAAGRVKPVIKIQSILPAIEDNPQEFYDIFAPISDMVSANPLIDFMQSTSKLPKIENFSCPQIYQRLVVGADGLCMMCANDEDQQIVVGDTNKESLHDIWHGKEMTRVRSIHRRCAGVDELTACSECYLPLKTYDSEVVVGDRAVTAEKYVSGKQKVIELMTPEKFKRQEIKV
jgi:sulfatase maturation enzyme AslB (radical SAM superfamily)